MPVVEIGKTIYTPEQATAEIERIYGEALKDPAHALLDGSNPEHQRVVDWLSLMFEKKNEGNT